MKDIKLGQIVQPLLAWYDLHARILPWRENTDPYRVWVSEIMLQQTRVEAVKPYYERFMGQLPDIESLAHAEEAALLKLWEGLGYYARVRNLQKAAKRICHEHGGQFPRSYEQVLQLPGIGTYTAGAICSISFDMPTPAVDGNVLRVVARLTEDYGDIATPAMKARITHAMERIYPTERCGDFTQALMELGALLCVPSGPPHCTDCPLAFCCGAYQSASWQELPVKAKKQPRRQETKTVLLLRWGEQVALRRREDGGLLGGLWEFPNVPNSLSLAEVSVLLEEWKLSPKNVQKAGTKRHIFTHVEWELLCYTAQCDDCGEELVWVTQEILDNEITLPTAFKKLSVFL